MPQLHWCKRQGYHGAFGKASRHGTKRLETSGGTAILCRSHIASAPVAGLSSSRYNVMRLNLGKRTQLHVVSIYAQVGLGATGANLELLAELGEYLGGLQQPWVVAGDWNMTPEELQDTDWLRRVRGTMVCPSQPTCRSALLTHRGESTPQPSTTTQRRHPGARPWCTGQAGRRPAAGHGL